MTKQEQNKLVSEIQKKISKIKDDMGFVQKSEVNKVIQSFIIHEEVKDENNPSERRRTRTMYVV